MQQKVRGFVALALVAAGGALWAVTPASAAHDHTLNAKGAVLQPSEVVSKPLSGTQGCQVLLDTGTGDCAVVNAAHGTLVFTVEAGAYQSDVLVERPWIVRVYRVSPTNKDQVDLALSTQDAKDPDGAMYANVTAKVADVTGDGKDELIVGYRSEGTGQILDMDIVGARADGTPVVLAHEQLYKGIVDVRNSKIVTWMPIYKKTDANCCPTWFRRDVITYRRGAFVVHAGKRFGAEGAKLPPGNLG